MRNALCPTSLIIIILCCFGAFLLEVDTAPSCSLPFRFEQSGLTPSSISFTPAECTGTEPTTHTHSDGFPVFPVPETRETSEQELRLHIVRLEDRSFWIATPRNYTMWHRLDEYEKRESNGVASQFYRVHAPLATQLAIKVLKDGACYKKDGTRALVVDVGAHLGWFAWVAASYGCRVVAFEPQSRFITHMNATIHMNGWQDRVTIIQAGVSSQRGHLLLQVTCIPGICKTKHDQASDNNDNNDEQFVRVETVRLDDLIDPQEKVLLLKVDVEGNELDVFEGAQSVLQRTSHMMVETYPTAAQATHGYTMTQHSKTVTAMLRYLRETSLLASVATWQDEQDAARTSGWRLENNDLLVRWFNITEPTELAHADWIFTSDPSMFNDVSILPGWYKAFAAAWSKGNGPVPPPPDDYIFSGEGFLSKDTREEYDEDGVATVRSLQQYAVLHDDGSIVIPHTLLTQAPSKAGRILAVWVDTSLVATAPMSTSAHVPLDMTVQKPSGDSPRVVSLELYEPTACDIGKRLADPNAAIDPSAVRQCMDEEDHTLLASYSYKVVANGKGSTVPE